MIRGAVIHFATEQPLVCDLKALPKAGDACLVITNLRFVDGRKPTFIDHNDSWFLYPLSGLRFIEIPADAMTDEGLGVAALPSGEQPHEDDLDDIETTDDALAAEELLRRIRAT